MKIISEEITQVEVLTENTATGKKFFIEGIFLQADTPNRNRRIYPVQTLAKEVNRYNEEFVKRDRALGELGHPPNPTINLDRVSHKIIKLEQKGSDFIGKAELLETPMGKIAQSLLDSGVNLGVSSRGLGDLEPPDSKGISRVKENFMLATAADIVADPSAPKAFVKGLRENIEWMLEEDGSWSQVEVETARTNLNKLSSSKNSVLREEREQEFIKMFKMFLASKY